MCARCGEWLPAEAFRPRLAGGLRSWCNPCAVERTRQWQAEHRDELNAKRRAGPFPVTCADCGAGFLASRRRQVRCPGCQAEMRRGRSVKVKVS